MTIQQAVNELAMGTYPVGSCIDLHRPTGFYKITKTPDGIFSRCIGRGGKVRAAQREIPQYAHVGK